MTNRVRRSHDQWQAINDQLLSSGLKIGEFCIQQGISYQSFYNWRRRNKPAATSPSIDFIDFSAFNSTHSEQCWNIVLRLGNGVELQLSQQP